MAREGKARSFSRLCCSNELWLTRYRRPHLVLSGGEMCSSMAAM